MLEPSEPVLASVMAKKPSCVPATHPGTYFFFCAALPNLVTVSAGPRFCMLNGSRQDAETLPICSAINTEATKPMPLPPSSSGRAHEKKPSSPILATRSARNSCFASSASSVGAISSAANRRAVSWISCCSSVNSKFIPASFLCIPCRSSFEHDEDVPILDTVALFYLDLLDRAATGRIHGVFHLQCLDDEDFVVFVDLRTHFDEHVPHFSRQRSQNFSHGFSLPDLSSLEHCQGARCTSPRLTWGGPRPAQPARRDVGKSTLG